MNKLIHARARMNKLIHTCARVRVVQAHNERAPIAYLIRFARKYELVSARRRRGCIQLRERFNKKRVTV